MSMRYALVAARGEQIAAYLPDNYQVLGTVDGQTVIGGRDAAGWMLDAYVIPRLASGLYFATEIDLSHPAFKQLPAEPPIPRARIHPPSSSSTRRSP